MESIEECPWVRRAGKAEGSNSIHVALATMILVGCGLLASYVHEREAVKHAGVVADSKWDSMLISTHVGRWSLDMSGDVLEWDDGMWAVFACNPKEFAGTYQAFLDLVSYEDRARVDAMCRQTMQAKGSYRAVYKTTTGRYVRAYGKVVQKPRMIFAGVCIPATEDDYIIFNSSPID